MMYYAEGVHIAQTWTQVPILYFSTRQGSESEFVHESLSGNVNEPLIVKHIWYFVIMSPVNQIQK